jgi:hypothetical protein
VATYEHLGRFAAGLESETQQNEYPEGVLPIAWWCLWNKWEPWVELDIGNNEGNLAGLVSAEILPERLLATGFDKKDLWKKYLQYFDSLAESDARFIGHFSISAGTSYPFHISLKFEKSRSSFNRQRPIGEVI